jgi:16S rRNA (cytosine967-C5)-methyltransferase
MLEEENGARVRAFTGRHPELTVVPTDEVAAVLGSERVRFLASVKVSTEGLLMTPRRTGTDGFFVSVMRRR